MKLFGLILTVLSAIYAVLAWNVKAAAGPYWLNPNLDPAYVYLISGLQIFVGAIPGQYEHPGTPLQILIAAVINLLNLLNGTNDVVMGVLIDPERYLFASWFLLTGIFIASQWCLCFFAYRRTRDPIFSLCLFVPAFLFLTFKARHNVDLLIPIAANVVPEHLLMTLVNLYVLSAVGVLTAEGRNLSRCAIYWGIVCGISLMTKLTFLPLLLWPLILLRGVMRLYFLAATAVAALGSSFPLFPIYGSVLAWFLKLGGHSGQYGSGEAGIIDPTSYLPNLLEVIQNHLLLVIPVGMGILMLFKRPQERPKFDNLSLARPQWAALVAMFVISLLLVAKMPGPHYLMPVYGLSGLMIGLVYAQLRLEPVRRAFGLAIAGIIASWVLNSVNYTEQLDLKMRRMRQFSQKVFDGHRHCLVLTFYRSSSMPYALFFGDSWYFRNTFAAYLDDLYPDSYFYDKVRGEVSNYSVFISVAELAKTHSCIMLFGDHEEYWDTDLLTKVREQDGERLYRLNFPALSDGEE